ncbi:MAG: type I DNA topoisomerase [Kiritimatiellae bacterium]|nr:type I DNA topoisomerase [Kiritimatiellia bacterium]
MAGKKLVIVESPAKAKTINRFLGTDYVVKSSLGHVCDLPENTLGVDLEHGFEPKYVLLKGKKRIVEELRRAAKDASAVYLAPDPDREGEAIAWHLEKLLRPGQEDKPFHRVQYNEITAKALAEAFRNPGSIDLRRVEAQQARRILDRIVGYKVSPVLWKHIRRGLSAGRVQSVALRMICEREDAIRRFVPEAYWIIGALVRKLVPPPTPFRIRLARVDGEKVDIRSEKEATDLKMELQQRELKVVRVAMRETTRRASPPFITSTLQQAAAAVCGFSPKRTMLIAQRLYEGVDLGDGPVGLITYMRTDSFRVAEDAVRECRRLISERYGEPYCPTKPNFFRSRESAQEAHEAIRPTDVWRTPESVARYLDPAELKLYRLIWQRFVASQMAAAQILQRLVEIEALPGPQQTRTFTFEARASEIRFSGYMEVLGRDPKIPDSDEEQEVQLPPLEEGERLQCIEWLSERKETQPPPRYTESSLVAALEKHGIGRPSTYAQIVSTLLERKYVTKEKRALVPTELGIRVNQLLVSTLDDLFNVKFTAAMEGSLDEIENGSLDRTAMLDAFYRRFQQWIAKTKLPDADMNSVETVLALLDRVAQWAPPAKRGRRVFSDEAFVKSIREQICGGKRAVSQRQLETLVRIALRYKAQIPDIEDRLVELGFGEFLEKLKANMPEETTLRKLEILSGIDLPDSARAFVTSLREQVEANRRLSPAQLRALDSILATAAPAIENYSEIRASLGLKEAGTEKDVESEALLEALKSVREWKPPVTRGERQFDDRAFYLSLQRQFEQKHFLSPRQKFALKRLVGRYRGQIPDYQALSARFGLGRRGKAGKEQKTDDSGRGDE